MLIDCRDFEFTPSRRCDGFGYVNNAFVIEIEAGNGVVTLGMRRLLFDGPGDPVVIEINDAVFRGICHLVGKDVGTMLLRERTKMVAKSGTVEHVVTKNECDLIAGKEILSDQERLGESLRLRLYGVLNGHSPVRSVAEQACEG